jgi:hypothetical protein
MDGGLLTDLGINSGQQNPMKILRSGLLAATALALGASTQAQVVAYNFGSVATPASSATLVSAQIQSASSFSSLVGGGAASGSGTGSNTAGGGGGAYFTASNWRNADGNYFAFTITPALNYQLSLSSFSFYYATSSSGPNVATLYSSADAYATALASFTMTPAAGTIAAADWHQNSASITLTGISTGTTFRLTAGGASNATGAFRIDAVTLNGTVTAIPETSTSAMLLGALALAGAVIHRGRLAKKPA